MVVFCWPGGFSLSESGWLFVGNPDGLVDIVTISDSLVLCGNVTGFSLWESVVSVEHDRN